LGLKNKEKEIEDYQVHIFILLKISLLTISAYADKHA